MGYLIVTLCFAYMFWVFISNADLKLEKIKSYLDRNNLEYVNHREVTKPYNPNFEIGEHLFTWLFFRKHHYEIDAMDLNGNPIIISVLHYQSTILFQKNRTYFKILKS